MENLSQQPKKKELGKKDLHRILAEGQNKRKHESVQEVKESRTRREHPTKPILVLFTGGTIGSVRLPNGNIVQPSEVIEQNVDTGNAKSLLLDEYQKKYPDSNINFNTKILMETLSENITKKKMDKLTKKLKEIKFEDYDGIVLTHGSDTLAYTANTLSMLLADIKVPMILVSSHYVLTDERANGVKNLKGAVDFISHVKIPGVYVTYHSEEETKVIYGSRVLQCEKVTHKFKSFSIGKNGEKNMRPLGVIKENGGFEVSDSELFGNLTKRSQVPRDNLLDRLESLNAQILVITPHIGLDYSNFNLDNIDAILHKTYHSGTSCTDGDNENLLIFDKKCKEKGVDLYLGPIDGDAERDVYSSTDKFCTSGGSTIMNISSENAFSKLLIAYSLYKNKEQRDNFIYQDVNEEFVRPDSKLKRKRV